MIEPKTLFIEKRVSESFKVLPGTGSVTVDIPFVPEYIKVKYLDQHSNHDIPSSKLTRCPGWNHVCFTGYLCTQTRTRKVKTKPKFSPANFGYQPKHYLYIRIGQPNDPVYQFRS